MSPAAPLPLRDDPRADTRGDRGVGRDGSPSIDDSAEVVVPLDLLVAAAKERLGTRWPAAAWDDASWDSLPDRRRHDTADNCRIHFRGLGCEEAFTKGYGDAVRAMVVLEDMLPKSARSFLTGPRSLWDTVVARLGRHAVVTLEDITAVDCDRTVERLQAEGYSEWSIYGFALRMQQFLAWCDENGVRTTPLGWKSPLVDPKLAAVSTHAGRQYRLSKLPTRRAREGLATVYHRATEPTDRLLICAVGLLALTGLRVSELITLPVDALFSEFRDGRTVWGIRYYNRKARGSAQQFAVRWLSPLGAELAQVLVREILSITSTARVQAAALEASAPAVRLPGANGRVTVSRLELIAALGHTQWTATEADRRGVRYTRGDANGRTDILLFDVASVEAWLAKTRPPLEVPIVQGVRVGLSKLLFCLPLNFIVHSPGGRTANVSEVFVTRLQTGVITRFLTGGRRLQSVFERFGIAEAPTGPAGEGAPCRMTSHMLRHWLNTLAHKSGMSAFQVTLWMQRADPKQTALYLHDARDVAELTRERILLQEMWGKRAEALDALPEADHRGHLEATLTVGHLMEEGTCTASMHLDMCEADGHCGPACGYWLHRRGDHAEVVAITRRRDRFAGAAARLAREAEAGRRVAPWQLAFYDGAVRAFDEVLGLTMTSEPSALSTASVRASSAPPALNVDPQEG